MKIHIHSKKGDQSKVNVHGSKRRAQQNAAKKRREEKQK